MYLQLIDLYHLVSHSGKYHRETFRNSHFFGFHEIPSVITRMEATILLDIVRSGQDAQPLCLAAAAGWL